jgi:hypothetical protein
MKDWKEILRRADLISEMERFKRLREEKALNRKKRPRTNAQIDAEKIRMAEYQMALANKTYNQQLRGQLNSGWINGGGQYQGSGSISGGVPVTPFTNTYSVEFDGSDDYVETGATVTDFGITNKFTVSCWIKAIVPGVGSWEGIFGCASSDSWIDGFALSFDSAGKLWFWVNHYLNYKAVSPISTINTGTWYHIMACYDATAVSNQMELFVDTLSVATATLTANVIDNSGTLCICDISSGGPLHHMNGNIDEVAVWNTDKRDDRAAIYNDGTPTDLTSLSPVGWWRMGDGDTFPTLTDHGSGSNDGTMENMDAEDIVADVPS